MIKGTVWLTPDDHALMSRLLIALRARDQANGLQMPADTQRDLLLSQAVTEGLQVIADRTLSSTVPPADPVQLAKDLQALFSGARERAA